MDQKSKFLSLRDIASQIDSGGTLETILQHLLAAACRYANWALGSIMAIDPTQGFGHVIVRHDPALIGGQLADKWDLATSPALVALRRNEPVYIRDAQESEEFPGYRQDALARDYRTVLVMPMNCKDALGRPMVLSVISRQVTEVEEDALDFLGTILHLGTIAVEHEHRLAVHRRTADRLKRALTTHTSLLEHVLTDGSVSSLSAMVGALLPNPVVVVDLTTSQIVAGRSPDPDRFDDAAWQEAAQNRFARQLTRAARDAADRRAPGAASLVLDDGSRQFRLSARIEPMFVDLQLVGAMIVFPTATDFGDLDHLMLDSAKFALSVQMMRSHIRFRAETRTKTDLFMELVEGRWRNAEELAQHAQRVGLTLTSPQQMIVLDFPQNSTGQGGISTDIARAVTRIMQQGAVPAGLIATEGAAVCMLPADAAAPPDRTARLARRIAEELGRHFGEEPVVVVSGPCSRLEDYPAAWDRCNRMIRIARAFGLCGVLAVQEFGPLAMLVAALDAGDVRRFVEDSVGALARHDRTNGTDYLPTLAAYLREGCRSQACADAMGLHVTTLRYRLSRIRELFGIDVETPERRFAAELAVRLHGITGSL